MFNNQVHKYRERRVQGQMKTKFSNLTTPSRILYSTNIMKGVCRIKQIRLFFIPNRILSLGLAKISSSFVQAQRELLFILFRIQEASLQSNYSTTDANMAFLIIHDSKLSRSDTLYRFRRRDRIRLALLN